MPTTYADAPAVPGDPDTLVLSPGAAAATPAASARRRPAARHARPVELVRPGAADRVRTLRARPPARPRPGRGLLRHGGPRPGHVRRGAEGDAGPRPARRRRAVGARREAPGRQPAAHRPDPRPDADAARRRRMELGLQELAATSAAACRGSPTTRRWRRAPPPAGSARRPTRPRSRRVPRAPGRRRGRLGRVARGRAGQHLVRPQSVSSIAGALASCRGPEHVAAPIAVATGLAALLIDAALASRGRPPGRPSASTRSRRPSPAWPGWAGGAFARSAPVAARSSPIASRARRTGASSWIPGATWGSRAGRCST